jgi:hypothetical protein
VKGVPVDRLVMAGWSIPHTCWPIPCRPLIYRDPCPRDIQHECVNEAMALIVTAIYPARRDVAIIAGALRSVVAPKNEEALSMA